MDWLKAIGAFAQIAGIVMAAPEILDKISPDYFGRLAGWIHSAVVFVDEAQKKVAGSRPVQGLVRLSRWLVKLISIMVRLELAEFRAGMEITRLQHFLVAIHKILVYGFVVGTVSSVWYIVLRGLVLYPLDGPEGIDSRVVEAAAVNHSGCSGDAG